MIKKKQVESVGNRKKKETEENEMAIGDCVLAKISKNDDQSVDDNDINVND